jgi:hypothetical protein
MSSEHGCTQRSGLPQSDYGRWDRSARDRVFATAREVAAARLAVSPPVYAYKGERL